MRKTDFLEEIKKRGKLEFSLMLVGLRNTASAARKYTLVLAYFFGLSLFLFREVLVRKGVVAFEDLAPFFSQTQFYEYQFSSWVKYTQGVPFRARYNLLFLWPQYLPFLKVSLVLITTLAGLLFFFSVIIILKSILKERVEKRHLALAIISSTYALFILLPAKLSHFNMTVLGTAFMSLALSLFVRALLEPAFANSLLLTVASVTLLHMTPSIHTVVLSYAGILFLGFISILLNRKLIRTLSLIVVVFLGHTVPYLIYMFSAAGSGNMAGVYQSAPTGYGVIKDGSVSPTMFFGSVHLSHLSKYVTGDYRPPFSPLLLFQAGFSGLCLIRFRKSRTVIMLVSIYLLAFFFALGFKSPLSGYNSLLKLSETIPFIEPLATIVIQVLRRPQRWLFLETYVRIVFFSLSAITVLDLMKTKISFRRKIGKRSLTIVKTSSYILIVLFMVSPFLVYPHNLSFTGDFGGTLKPVDIPQGMKDIKEIVNGGEKTVSLPLMGLKSVEWDGEKRLLEDEFYNYFFEIPSIEGTSGVSIFNQLSMFFGYHLLYNNLSASTGRYFSQLGVRYIFFHNDTVENKLANESTRVLSSLQSQADILLKYQNKEYYLFEVIANQEVYARTFAESRSLIFFYDTLWTPWSFLSEFNLTFQDAVFVDLASGDMSWSQFNNIVERTGNHTAIFLPRAYFEDKDIILSLLVKENGVLVKPSIMDLIEFEKNGWVTTSNLHNRYTNYFDYLSKYGMYGDFAATDKVFIASSMQNVVATFKFVVPKKGTYHMYVKLHAPDGAKFLLGVDGKSEGVEINSTVTYKFIEIFEGNLDKGPHKVSIKKLDKRPLVINLVYLIESEQLSNYTNDFWDLINNRHVLLSDTYSDIADHISKLSYPRNFAIYYYNRDLYSENLVFRIKDEKHAPTKAVYSGSFLILDGVSSGADVEPIHLPEEKIIRQATLGYIIYIALLWVGLGLVIMRLGHSARLHVMQNQVEWKK